MSNEMYYAESLEDKEYKTKNETILAELIPFIYNIQDKMRTETKEIVKTLNPVAQTKNKVMSILRRYIPLTTSQCYKLDAQTVWTLYNDYLDLIQQINEYMPYQPNKLEFCAYTQITASFYEEQLNDTTVNANEEQLSMHEVFVSINDTMVESTFSGAENGAIDAKSAQLRSKSRKYGNNISETSDINGIIEQTTEALTAASYINRLSAIANNKPKLFSE